MFLVLVPKSVGTIMWQTIVSVVRLMVVRLMCLLFLLVQYGTEMSSHLNFQLTDFSHPVPCS